MGKGYAGIQPCMISWKQCFAALVGFVIIFVVILYVVDANAAATTTQTMKIDGMPRMMDGEPEISLISRGGESVVRVRGYFVGMMVKTALAKPGPGGRLELRVTYDTVHVPARQGKDATTVARLKGWRTAYDVEMW